MTRKAKILIASAVLVVGISAAFFWPRAGVKVIAVNAAMPNATAYVTVKNTSTRRYYCLISCETEGTASGRSAGPNYPGEPIDGLSTETFQATYPTSKQWRAVVYYGRLMESSFVSRTREKLANRAIDRGWLRTFRLLVPTPKYRVAYGPVMVGDKPVSAKAD